MINVPDYNTGEAFVQLLLLDDGLLIDYFGPVEQSTDENYWNYQKL
ncbi:hypothetical protein ACQKTA_07260 [Enterococcus sp. 22-H-5-01]